MDAETLRLKEIVANKFYDEIVRIRKEYDAGMAAIEKNNAR